MMKSLKELKNNHNELRTSILLGLMGSESHGTHIPNSDPNSIDDRDLMGVCLAHEDVYLGLKRWGSRGTKELKDDPWDIVLYEVRKMISLLLKGNPNVLGLLYLKPNFYIHIKPEGQLLIDNRSIFSSKQVYHSFTGYAYGQLKRMTRYKFEGYMGEKRKKLVDKFGYDVKNAAHCIRLLRMGIEFLNEGILYVHREDAEQLKEIKTGEWELSRVIDEAERLFRRAEEAYDRTTLPNTPDYKAANKLCKRILKEKCCSSLAKLERT